MEDSVPLAQFTTYLGYLVNSAENNKLNQRPLAKKTLQINPLINKDILGTYEATITVCSYFSRLNYENRTRKVLKMYGILDYSPLVFNKALSYLTYSKSTDDRVEKSPESKKPSGYLLYDKKDDEPLSITVQPILGEKSLVISFRGTLSVKSLIKDLNIAYRNLFDLFGTELFDEEYKEVQGRGKSLINPFGAHRGFVNGLINLSPIIIDRVKRLLVDHPDTKKIFVTGHSLGGAYANLMGLGLAQLKKKGTELPMIHVITFGAPKTFTPYARNIFNNLLIGGFMTFDRVANRPRWPDPTMLTYDPIPLIPPHLEHPGFMILNPEIKTQSRTGRTKHVSELRDELANIKAKRGLISWATSRNYNSLPDYPEFYSKFRDSSSLTVEEYSKLLAITVGGTVRTSSGPAGKIVEIVKSIFHVSTADLAAADKAAVVEEKKEVAELKKEQPTVPKEVVENVEKAKEVVGNQYEAAGQEDPTEVAENKKGGGDLNRDSYKKQTVLEQPNHLVYSCQQITAPVPMTGCHLGYMGVGWLGGTFNAGSGTPAWRGYEKEATLYCTDGLWTFVTDIKSGGHSRARKTMRKKRNNYRL